MTEDEREALQYRFSGYQLPTEDYDAIGGYIVLDPHPYYYNQPRYWATTAVQGNRLSNSADIGTEDVIPRNPSGNTSGTQQMLPL